MSRHVLVVCLLLPAIAVAQKQFGFDNKKASGQPYLKPEETVAKMKVPDGFTVGLYAGEPMVVNPIAFTVDERGRVWVVECFEYPSRTPKGKKPRDRIVILEDTDGDGVADKRTVFAEGKDFPDTFDMASGIEVGYGGVFLGAPPYLWFIENKNDKPGKFTKLLGGFGSQDTHETLNTFQWGPDGWLYGLHGIYTQSKVVPTDAVSSPPVEINAGLWRFHPRRHTFEVVSEGTSNPWGWDYRNSDGQTIAACCVIPHLFHLVPGGTYKRQGGQGFNPFAFGQLNEICDHTFHKESGWAHAGLLSLDTPLMPAKYRESVIFGSIHGCSLKRNSLKPNGSTYTASREDDFLTSGDKNFRPINLRWGPNGEILLIDWHDQNPCHQAAPDSWDATHGRIYSIRTKGLNTKKPQDIGKLSDLERPKLLADPNPYRYRTALRLIAERAGKLSSVEMSTLPGNNPVVAQRNHWGFICGELFDLSPDSQTHDIARAVASGTMAPAASSSAVRLLSDFSRPLPDVVLVMMESFVRNHSTAPLRLQMIAACVRWRKQNAVMPILHALMRYPEDATDPAIPTMLWLAYEPLFAKDAAAELDWLAANAANNPLVTDFLIPRAVRRLAVSGQAEHMPLAVAFLGKATGAPRRRGLEGMAEALKGRAVEPPANWEAVQTRLIADADPQVQKLAKALAANFNDRKAAAAALAVLADAKSRPADRLDAVRVVALTKPPQGMSPLVALVREDGDEAVRVEACRALAGYEGPEVAALVGGWATYPPALRAELVNLLAGRKTWAKTLLEAVAAKTIDRSAVSANAVVRLQAFKDKALDALVESAWGKTRDTPAELLKLIDTMRGELDKAPGSFAKGKAVFEANCAKCHQFEGKGYTIGPALDGAGRDVEYILVNVLDPNRTVGAPYFVRQVLLKNGRLEQGLLHAEDPQTISLKGENDAIKVIAKKDAETIEVSERSMMPEGLSYNMTTQDFRDLVRYLTASPVVADWTLTPGGRVRLGATGRLELKPGSAMATVVASAAFKTKLLLGSGVALRVTLDGKEVYAGTPGDGSRPDQAAVDVELSKGEHTLVVETKSAGTLIARFLDPDRRLSYPEK